MVQRSGTAPPNAGPTLDEIRIETKDRQVLLRAGDSEPIRIWAAYNNGQEVLLEPEDDQVEFTTNRVRVRQDRSGWSLMFPSDEETQEAFNERVTVTYRNVTSRTTVLLRPAIEAPPNTDEQCRHRVAGIPDPVTADTVAVHMDRRTRTEREAGQTAETLGATLPGRLWRISADMGYHGIPINSFVPKPEWKDLQKVMR